MKKAHVLKNKNLVVSPDFCLLWFNFFWSHICSRKQIKIFKKQKYIIFQALLSDSYAKIIFKEFYSVILFYTKKRYFIIFCYI